jgi:uncharacterized protein YdhG (YjbR/CyaY superfamily)
MDKPKSTEEYISRFPKETQILLQDIRKTIKNAAPKADELISYGMPAYKLNGKALVYFFCRLQKPYWILRDTNWTF